MPRSSQSAFARRSLPPPLNPRVSFGEWGFGQPEPYLFFEKGPRSGVEKRGESSGPRSGVEKRGDDTNVVLLFGDPVQFLVNALYLIPALLIGLIGHELAHAVVAVARGD